MHPTQAEKKTQLSLDDDTDVMRFQLESCLQTSGIWTVSLSTCLPLYVLFASSMSCIVYRGCNARWLCLPGLRLSLAWTVRM